MNTHVSRPAHMLPAVIVASQAAAMQSAGHTWSAVPDHERAQAERKRDLLRLACEAAVIFGALALVAALLWLA